MIKNTFKSCTCSLLKSTLTLSVVLTTIIGTACFASHKLHRTPKTHKTPKTLSSAKSKSSSNKSTNTTKYKGSYTVKGKRYNILSDNKGFTQVGLASWYGPGFHGKKTADGEKYNMYAMTGAHKSLPLPTYAKVTNLENNKTVVIKINDRGPYHSNRVLDLSKAAAQKLGMLHKGTAKVSIVAL